MIWQWGRGLWRGCLGAQPHEQKLVKRTGEESKVFIPKDMVWVLEKERRFELKAQGDEEVLPRRDLLQDREARATWPLEGWKCHQRTEPCPRCEVMFLAYTARYEVTWSRWLPHMDFARKTSTRGPELRRQKYLEIIVGHLGRDAEVWQLGWRRLPDRTFWYYYNHICIFRLGRLRDIWNYYNT